MRTEYRIEENATGTIGVPDVLVPDEVLSVSGVTSGFVPRTAGLTARCAGFGAPVEWYQTLMFCINNTLADGGAARLAGREPEGHEHSFLQYTGIRH